MSAGEPREDASREPWWPFGGFRRYNANDGCPLCGRQECYGHKPPARAITREADTPTTGAES